MSGFIRQQTTKGAASAAEVVKEQAARIQKNLGPRLISWMRSSETALGTDRSSVQQPQGSDGAKQLKRS